MAQKLTLDLVTPTQVVFSKPVKMVVIPGADGTFGVLADHAPVISTLQSGVVDVYENAEEQLSQRIFVSGGFVEVNEHGCTVLAEEAIDLKDAKRSDAEARVEQARKAIARAANDFDRQQAEKTLATAESLLSALK